MTPNTQTVVTELRRWHGLKGAIVFLEAAELLERLERERDEWKRAALQIAEGEGRAG